MDFILPFRVCAAYALQALVGTLSSFSFWGCATAGSCVVGSLHAVDEGKKIIHIKNVIEAKSRLRETITVIDQVLSAIENETLNLNEDEPKYLAEAVRSYGIESELTSAQEEEVRQRNRPGNPFGSP